MKKIKDFIINHKLYFIYSISIVLIYLILSFILSIYPLGSHTFIKFDFLYQYYPMMQELYNRIYEGKSLIYSFNDGLGMSIYRNILYYLSSPLYLVFLLVKDHILACHLIIFIKSFITGFTMLFYLKHKFKSNNILLLIPTLCYTLCGWFNAFYLNIMWLDGLMMLPLITLGIESLINEKKYKLYIFSLAYTIICNYYLGYMICVFCLLYFLIYNLCKIKNEGSFKYKLNELSRNLIYFSIASIMAAILSSIVLLPVIGFLSTLESKMIGFYNPYEYNMIDFIAGSLAFSSSTILGGIERPVSPNVYTGIISIILLIPFIFNKDIKKNTKIVYISLLTVFFLIMKIDILDFFMNGLHIPAGFPYRYSFMYSFIFCIITAYTLLNIKSIKPLEVILSGILISILVLIVYFIGTIKIESNLVLYNYFFITIIVLLLLLKKHKLSQILLYLIVCAELITSFVFSSNVIDISLVNNEYEKRYHGTIEKPSTNEFYRSAIIYNNCIQSKIDDFYGIESFNSMIYSSIYYFVHSIGLGTDYSAHINYTTGSYLANLLFSVKDIHTFDETKINEERLSLIYGIDKKQERILNENPNFYRTSNLIVEDLTNIKDLYSSNTYISKKILYEDDHYKIYKYKYPKNTLIKTNMSDLLFVISNDIKYSLYKVNIDYKLEYKKNTVLMYPYMVDVTNGEVIIGYFKERENEDYIISYQIDTKKATDVYNYLNRYPAKIDYFNEDYIEATINLDKDMSIMSSIPYDEGWHVYVDDKEVETYGQFNAFLGFDLSQGEHKIKLKYKTPYLKEGLLVSCISFICIIVFDIVNKKLKNKRTTSK